MATGPHFNEAFPKTISKDLLHVFLKFAAQAGFSLDTLSEIPGLPHDHDQDRPRVSIKHFIKIWNFIESRMNDSCPGLHFGQYFIESSWNHILFSLMKNSATVGDAIRIFFRYHNLMTDIIKPEMISSSDTVHVTYNETVTGLSLNRHHVEAILCIIALSMNRLTEKQVSITRTCFKHAPPENKTEYHKIFGKRISFNESSNELVFPKHFLNTPIFLADENLNALLEKYAQNLYNKHYPSKIMTGKVLEIIYRSLKNGEDITVGRAAEKIDISIRLLQNKLKNEGVTFQKILDHVRCNTAVEYLKDKDIEICDIAFLLGYSEQSAFNHAFKKWTGITPNEYRKKT